MKSTTEMMETALNAVYGRTAAGNLFDEETYNSFGIRVKPHFFMKDEFFLPDGTKTNEDGANEYIRKVAPDFFHIRTEYPELLDIENIGHANRVHELPGDIDLLPIAKCAAHIA